MVFKVVFILLILIRIVLFLIPGFEIDINSWKAWAERLNNLGLSNFYSSEYFSDYFPGYLYILWIAGGIYKTLLPSLSFISFQFEFLLKFITLIFEIGTSVIIYKILERISPKLKEVGAILYLGNPASIFNSSIWGQVDGIFTFFVVSSSFFLFNLKKPLTSSFLSAVGFLVKPHSLPFFPAMLFYTYKEYKKKLFTVIAVLIISPIFLSLPFFGNVAGLFPLALKSADVYPYTSLFAFNFWGIFGWWKIDSEGIIFSYRILGYLIYLVGLVAIFYPWIKNKIKPEIFFTGISLSFLSFFLFATRVHERYLFPFLAFILIASLVGRSKMLILSYFFMTTIHFINLWFVYYYYMYVFIDSSHSNNIIYSIVNKNHGILSFISIVLFFLILIYYYKTIYDRKN